MGSRPLVYVKAVTRWTINLHNSEQHWYCTRFNYLGSWLTSDASRGKEIKQRINLKKSSFNSIETIFRDRMFSIQLKQGLWNASFGRFSCVAMNPGYLQQSPGKPQKQHKCWICRMQWTALQANVTILHWMTQKRKLVCCIEQRQLKFLGHFRHRRGI